MTQNPTFDAKGKQLLNRVEKGMAVFDRAGHEIGKVDGTFMPAETADPEGPATKPQIVMAPAAVMLPVVPVVASASSSPAAAGSDLLPTDDTFPKVLRDRLVNNGFLRIHSGLLHHHRYAMPDQIEAVDSAQVRLKVAEDDLIKH